MIIIWVGDVACLGEVKSAYKILIGNLNGRHLVGDLHMDE
jgi:hypothetical protein